MSENWIENKIYEGKITEYKFEEFEEFKMISTGAFSKVYKARQRSTKNIHALKIIESNAQINKELVNELNNMISMKSHKSIIEFYGITKYKDQIDPSVIKYVLCWQGTQDERPSTHEVAMELKNIAQEVSINYIFDIHDIKTVEILLTNVFESNLDLNEYDMPIFANKLYSTCNKLFNEGRSVSDVIINFISKHNKTQEEVFNWLLKNNDNSKYICLLGLFYSWSIGTVKSDTESFNLFFNAANKGDGIAQYFVGRCYEVGWNNTKKNMREAIDWYNKAIKNGCAAAERILGDYYYKNDKYTQAFELLQSAVNKGNVIAMTNLGLCYQRGRGTDTNMVKGFKLFEQAATMGLPASQYELGKCYEQGKGIEKDLKKALDWYEKAAEKDRTYRNDRERLKAIIIKRN
ncbi:8433_t:CDS:2 [Dentiscutata erythropus]|uniref:8433_t:CDS:1 n=1 Tax=Dentiscutata erythropus TaxID=1348616 RepID=A0A9N9I2W8_9GLOM|nr:8433_t:CDS:2 [Dentiscutata erythropus]